MAGDDRRYAADGGQPRATLALLQALSPLDERTEGLLRALAHQLRNPLTSVSGYVELMIDGSLGPLTDEQVRVLRTVTDGMARLSEFIDELEPRTSARG